MNYHTLTLSFVLSYDKLLIWNLIFFFPISCCVAIVSTLIDAVAFWQLYMATPSERHYIKLSLL